MNPMGEFSVRVAGRSRVGQSVQAMTDETAPKGTKADPLSTWSFVPLYGLLITDDRDGVESPIFGDATLVSREWYVGEVRKRAADENEASLLTGPVGDATIDGQSIPKTQLVQLVPHSYIAVRRQPADALQQAEKIRALLTATMFLRAGYMAGFAFSASHVTWTAQEHMAFIQPGGQVLVQRAFRTNQHVFSIPLEVDKARIRRSWETGEAMSLSTGDEWDISSAHPVCSLLTSCPRTKRERRLCDLAIHLARTSCTPDPMNRLQMALTGLELALWTTEHKVLKRRAFAVLLKPKDQDRLDEVLLARHDFVHEGKVPPEGKANDLAVTALIFAYSFFDRAVGALDVYPVGGFDDVLDMHVQVKALEDAIEKLHSPDIRSKLSKAIRQAVPLESLNLTARVRRVEAPEE